MQPVSIFEIRINLVVSWRAGFDSQQWPIDGLHLYNCLFFACYLATCFSRHSPVNLSNKEPDSMINGVKIREQQGELTSMRPPFSCVTLMKDLMNVNE